MTSAGGLALATWRHPGSAANLTDRCQRHLTLLERMLLGGEEGIGQSLMHWHQMGNSAAITAITRYMLPAHRTRPSAALSSLRSMLTRCL